MTITKITIDGIEYELTAVAAKPVAPQKPTPEERLLQIIEGTVNHFDNLYPDSVFWMKDGLMLFELNFENMVLWVKYNGVWGVFETTYKMNYKEVQTLIKTIIEKRFKIGSLTPITGDWVNGAAIEKRFKIGSLTPAIRIG